MATSDVPTLEVPEATLSFLSPDEESSLSEVVRGKILDTFQALTRNYHNAVNIKQRDRSSLEQSVQKFEAQLKELKDQNESLATQLQNERKTTEEYIERYRKSSTSTNELEDAVRKLQTDLSEAQIKLDQLSTEKQDLVSILEKRNAELENLNQNAKNLSEQLQSATAAKIEALVKVDELTSKEMELDYREKQQQTEKGWMSKQVQLLTDELDRKNNEIVDMHRQSALKLLSIQTEVSEKGEQLRLVEMSMANLKQSNQEQEAHIERLMQKLKESQELETKMEENYRQELKSQKRIAELYKDSSEEASKKAEEMEEAVSNLQDLLKLATERYGELETKFNKCGKSFQEEISTRDEKITKLTEELNRGNELLGNIKKQGLTDEMIASLSPAAAAACSLLKSSHSLTEIYSKHQSLNEQLLTARDENARLNDYISQIVGEIEERTPLLKTQKEDYDRALETVNALQNQLDLALQSEENAIQESKFAKDQLDILHRENERYKTQIKDSAMQIKTLLREVETHRGGYVFERSDNLSMQEVPDMASSSSIVDSSRVISERLVTFRNIDELQSQNQYLLSLVRELSEERENAKDTIDQTHLEQIKAAFEEAKKEVSDLREARLRQERMFQGIIEQRDSYATMLAQQKSPGTTRSPTKSTMGMLSPHLTPVSGSIASITEQSNRINTLEKQIIELTVTHKQLKEEYDTYRKEKHEHEKIASEQMERLRDDLTRMRSENAKLSSQTEYNNERGKIYAANLETYKKTINMLEEKNKQCNLTIMKHEQSIVALKAEFAESSNKLAKAEVSLSSMIQERNMLRDARSHLEAEKNLLQKEMMTQKVLQLNLANIKNNLDMAGSAAVIKLENQIETLQKENTILRRRVDTENERFKDTVLSWDKINKDVTAKFEKEKTEHDATKKQLQETQDTVTSQRHEIEEMLTKVSVLTGSGALKQGHADAIPTLAQIELEKKTKELNLKLIEAQTEIRSVKQQLELARASIEEYKGLSNSMEQQLQSATASRESYNNELSERLACKDDIIREVQSKLDSIEGENLKLREENERLQRDMEGKSSTVDEELSRMRRELQTANSKLQSIMEENVAVRNDLEAQARQAEEFRLKYENEMDKHMQQANIQELQDALAEMRDKLNDSDRLKRKADEASREAQTQWESQERGFRQQLEQMQSNLSEVESLNNSLQDQLIALTTQLTSLRNLQREPTQAQAGESPLNQSFTSYSGDTSLNTSFSEQDKKTTEQWMQLIRYMRRQKEIAFTQSELAQSAMQRMETQLKFMEKQYEEVKAKLSDSQDGSQVNFITSAKQAELMRKVETLSALTDSNRMLREEKEAALKEILELKSKLAAIDKEMGPLRATNSELESKCDALSIENTSVKQDASRWRARASALLEKSNKFNPEEWKKLEQEKDNLQKQVSTLNDNAKKQQQEIARQNLTINRLQQQVNALTATNTSLTNDKKASADELRRVSEESARVQGELNGVKAELDKVTSTLAERDSELVGLQAELAKTKEFLENERGIVKQVKLIARKYKKQFEDAQKENETLTEQKASLEATAASTAQRSSENKETQEDGELPGGLSTEEETSLRTEMTTLQGKIQELNDANENLKREVETLKSREERAKSAIKATRDKMTASNSQRNELETEVNELRAKVTSLETSREEAEVRQAAVKSQYEGRINRLEKEKQELQASLASPAPASGTAGPSSAPDPNAGNLVAENERLKNEIEMQRQRILAIEKQYKLQMSQTQTGKGQPTQEKSQAEPPKANIKPIAGTKASAQTSKQATTQVVPPGTSRPQPTASIRPMSMPRKATVMPTASSAPSMVQLAPQQSQQPHSMVSPVTPLVAPVSQAQVSTSTPDQSSSSAADQHHLPVTSGTTSGTVTNSSNVRQATVQPTPAVSTPSITPLTMSSTQSGSAGGTSANQQQTAPDRDPVAGSEEGPSTSTSSHLEDADLGDSSEQVSSSEPSNNQHAVGVTVVRGEQRTSQSSQPSDLQQSISVREEPSPSTSTSGARPTQSTKRTRTSESSHEPKDEPETKRTRMNMPIPVEREAEAMAHQQEPHQMGQQEHNEADQKSAIGSASGGVQDDDDDSDVIVIESDDEDEDVESGYQAQPRGRGRQQDLDEEEEGTYEDVEEEVEEEEMGDEEERVDEEEEGDAEGEDDAGEEDEGAEGMEFQDDDESVGDPEEGREAESLEEIEDNNAGQPRFSESEAENIMIADDGQEASERVVEGGEGDEDSNIDIDPESQVAEGGEASPAQEPPRFRSGGPTSSTSTLAEGAQSSSFAVASGSRGILPLRSNLRRDRVVPSFSRPQQQMTLSYASQQASGYGEEADESIVPSTPTLVVPRRTDGFAEVVNSPQVPAQARFTFGSGMDLQDARMEYQQYDDGTGRSVPTTPLQVSPPEVGDLEQDDVSGGHDDFTLQESSDVQPSSSEATPRSHDQEIPTITITSARGSTLHAAAEQPEQETESSSFEDLAQRDIDVNPDDCADEPVLIIQGRTESSVTSSDEDKLDASEIINTSSSSTVPQQPSTSSLSRPASPSPSQGATSSEQQPQQHRVRPTPIIWDQPTSSSSSLQQVPQQRVLRGRGGIAGGQNVRPMQVNPEQIGGPAMRGGFHQLRGAQQSARRSRPHGRGVMRGARGTGPPY